MLLEEVGQAARAVGSLLVRAPQDAVVGRDVVDGFGLLFLGRGCVRQLTVVIILNLLQRKRVTNVLDCERIVG